MSNPWNTIVNVASGGTLSPNEGPINGTLGSGYAPGLGKTNKPGWADPVKTSDAGNTNSGGMPQFTETPGYKATASNALNPGPSAWADLANRQQDMIGSNTLDKAAQSVAGQTAGADASLAANGGLSSGARERIAEGGAKNMAATAEDTSRQTGLNKMQIGMNDQTNKMQQLGSLNNMDMSNYQNQLQAWGANQTANAMSNSGKSGGK